MADEMTLVLPPIAFIFGTDMEEEWHKRINDSLASFVAELIKAYTREYRTFEDIMLLDMLDNDCIIVNDIDDENRGWQCVICNHTIVRERMKQGLPFMINFHVQGLFKG